MRVAVSFLSKNEREMSLGRLLELLPRLEAAGVDTIQWDLMDGRYNGNDTMRFFSPEMMESLMENTTMGGEAHMMVSEPWKFFHRIKNCASMFIFHVEACQAEEDVRRTIDVIKSSGKKAGIALEPDTPLEKIRPYLGDVDLVLVMTVHTGQPGQGFIDMSGKIHELARIKKECGLNYEIEADGGINDATVKIVRAAGCEAVNSASYILGNDFAAAVRALKGARL